MDTPPEESLMTPEGSVTRWLGQLQAGDDAAVQQLWQRYFKLLVGLARKRLAETPRRAADEEDVALSAFDSFCRNAEAGRFPSLTNRDSLWRLLVVITARKVAHLKRDETRQKRGGEVGPSDQADDSSAGPALEQVLSREPTPEMAAQVAEECRRLLATLRDPELEAVAILRMEGHSVEEIGTKLGFAPRSIKRKLQMIRRVWEKEQALA
jgi:DNA-directed RNA polymerase specialized sigma24 family protein